MSSIARRIRPIVKHLASVRGILLVLSFLLAAAATLTEGTTSALATLAAAVTTSSLLFLLSFRLSDQHRTLGKVEREQKRLSKTVAKLRPAPAKTPPSLFGPDPAQRRADRLDKARSEIRSVRGNLAAESSSPPSTRAEETEPVHLPGPAVSVVVSCRNNARLIGAALESIRRQSFTDWECIIVDDASMDASVAEAYRFVRTDNRFSLVRHKVGGGPSAARNTGLRLARAHLVTFLDADDMLMADSLLDRIETLAGADASVAGSYSGTRVVPRTALLDNLAASEDWTNRRYLDFVSANGRYPFPIQAPLLRTDIVQRAGGFDESMTDGLEDWDLWLRLMRSGYGFIPARWRTVVERANPDRATGSEATQSLRLAQDLAARAFRDEAVAATDSPFAFSKGVAEYGQQLINAERALQYAATALATGDRESARSIIADGDVVIEPWMDRHFGFDKAVDTALQSAFSLTSGEVNELADELAPLRSEMASLIEGRASAATTQGEPPLQPNYDTVFVPLNLVQAEAMLGIAASLPGSHSVAFLNTERVTGAAGVGATLAGSRHPVFTVNRWVLDRAQHRNLVVAFPRDGVSEELIAVTTDNGGRVLELVAEGDDVMRVAATPDYGREISRLDAIEIGKLLTASDQPIPSTTAVAPGLPRTWFGTTEPNPDRAFVAEEYPATTFDGSAIERFKDIHRGERCVIIGNGPSLNQLHLPLLQNEYTIGVNGIFYAAEQMGFDPSYYVVEDTAVIKDNLEMIKRYPAGHKFFPSIYRDQVGEAKNVSYFMMNRGYYEQRSPAYCVPRFSTDVAQRAYSGQSVTIINLQLAYYMGFSEVVLIGMDFSYTIPDDAEIDGVNITSMSDDPNHFHPDYFGKGKVWKDPQLDRVLANYQLAKLMYEADGRRIVNATAGGNLDLFDRVPYEDLFG
ncbi:MAG: glycosyltransferase [Acidimicrobiia bacterium]|nr:glycosyltransferase [Acidimicrobiia bacterium]